VLRAHRVVKGRRRDSATYSMTEDEWPSRRDAIRAWLAPDNISPEGKAVRSLASFRT
jgi:hypothetical protein